MNISDLSSVLGFKAVQSVFDDRPISDGFTSDLLSDVMGKAKADSVLITIQAHKNTVAVSSLAGICAVVVCSNRPIPDDMVSSAREEGIAVFLSHMNQFEVSGLVWERLRG
jgi:hypothetical protein